MVEHPYEGRAKVLKEIDGVTIVIPTAKPWAIIAFMSFWLLMWAFGLVMAFGFLGGSLFGGFPAGGLFMIVWICAWTAGGLMAGRMLIWLIAGEEIITAGNGILTIRYKNLFFSSPKSYDLGAVKNLRVFDDGYGSMSFFNSRGANDLFKVGKRGVIRFH